MSNYSPGFNPRRLVTLMMDAIQRCELHLDGINILTEAATGIYAVTSVLSAMAGARKVFAFCRNSSYGTVEEAIAQTKHLAELAGVSQNIEFITEKSEDIVAQADIITNTGHLRPIDAKMISWMKPTAVIPLMYEAWELRPGDINIGACRQRGIKVAGINERHPDVDVFSFLGVMAIKLLLNAGIAVYKSNILLLCDNHFAEFIENALVRAGASVDTSKDISVANKSRKYDVILVAMQPKSEPVLSSVDAALIAHHWSGVVVTQLWGDIDRIAFLSNDISVFPLEEPKKGHMAMMAWTVSPEPIIRLQTGGLKVGELLWHSCKNSTSIQDDLSQELVNSQFIDQIISC